MSATTAVGRLGRFEFIALMTALIAINAFAIDIMLPGLQDIGAALGEADPNNRQLVITAYFLGFALFQIVFGPLSDRFGRRIPLLVGLCIYCGSAVACLFVKDFQTLLVLRFIQGAGAAASAVIATAVIRDVYGGAEMAATLSLVFMVLMISPIVAPSVGQAIMSLIDWHAIFAFMALVGIIATIWTFTRLPETLKPADKRPFTVRSITEGFGYVFMNRSSIGYILATGIVIAALFGFLNSSQQIYAELYGLGPWFPLAFASIGIVMSIGSFLNAKLVERLGMRRIAHGATILFTIFSAVLIAFASFGPVPLPVFMILLGLIFLSFSGIGANYSALALEPLGEVAGTAASAQGFIQMVVGTLIGAMIGQAFDGTVLPIALGYFVLGAAALALVLFAEKGRLFAAPPKPL